MTETSAGAVASRPGAEKNSLPAANEQPGLARAIAWTSVGAVIVPLGGLLVQPILAHSLGVTGRGQYAAAVAPATLAASVCALGLPEALTYFIAKKPHLLRRAVAVAGVLSLMAGTLGLGVVFLSSSLLAGGDDRLADLIVVAAACSVPLLLVGVLRGAATGRQLYSLVAAESVVNALARLGAFVALAASGALTPVTAVAVTYATQLAAGALYLRPLLRGGSVSAEWSTRETTARLATFGGRLWFGAVASMLLGKTSQVLMVPLSTAEDLGLYAVVTAVVDVPVLMAFAIAAAISGVNSVKADWARVARSSRCTLLICGSGCLILAATLHLWIGAVFGQEFTDAYWPVQLGLVSGMVAVPAYVVLAGLSSSGYPGARSAVYVIALVINTVLFFALVPSYGVFGATLTSVVTAVVLTATALSLASRRSSLSFRSFIIPERDDVLAVGAGALAMVSRVKRVPRSAARFRGHS